MVFYAVKKRKLIFDDYEKARQYKSVKKFATRTDAQSFLDGTQVLLESEGAVYTDGGCRNNVGSIGVFFGDDSKKNVSEKLEGHNTSQTAELKAIIRALELHAGDLKIYSDSKYAVFGIKVWFKKWDSSRVNYGLFKRIKALCKDRTVEFIKVSGHFGCYGNERADALARLALKDEPSDIVGRLYSKIKREQPLDRLVSQIKPKSFGKVLLGVVKKVRDDMARGVVDCFPKADELDDTDFFNCTLCGQVDQNNEHHDTLKELFLHNLLVNNNYRPN